MAEGVRREDPAAGRPDQPYAGLGHAFVESATAHPVPIALVIPDGLFFRVRDSCFDSWRGSNPEATRGFQSDLRTTSPLG
jgi:hypothetical protein